MYFPIGWPKTLDAFGSNGNPFVQVVCNRDKILFAVLTEDTLVIWFCKVSQNIRLYRICLLKVDDLFKYVLET